MFGGGVSHSWPQAAVALHHFDGFGERFAKAVAVSEQVFTALGRDGRFQLRRVPNGTNIAFLTVKSDAGLFRKRLVAAGVQIGEPRGNEFIVQVNETWNRASAGEIAGRFTGAAATT